MDELFFSTNLLLLQNVVAVYDTPAPCSHRHSPRWTPSFPTMALGLWPQNFQPSAPQHSDTRTMVASSLFSENYQLQNLNFLLKTFPSNVFKLIFQFSIQSNGFHRAISISMCHLLCSPARWPCSSWSLVFLQCPHLCCLLIHSITFHSSPSLSLSLSSYSSYKCTHM